MPGLGPRKQFEDLEVYPIVTMIQGRKILIAEKMGMISERLIAEAEQNRPTGIAAVVFNLKSLPHLIPSPVVHYPLAELGDKKRMAAWVEAMPHHNMEGRLVTQMAVQQDGAYELIGEADPRVWADLTLPDPLQFEREDIMLSDAQRLEMLEQTNFVVDLIAAATP